LLLSIDSSTEIKQTNSSAYVHGARLRAGEQGRSVGYHRGVDRGSATSLGRFGVVVAGAEASRDAMVEWYMASWKLCVSIIRICS
jgi:hypothetical protein